MAFYFNFNLVPRASVTFVQRSPSLYKRIAASGNEILLACEVRALAESKFLTLDFSFRFLSSPLFSFFLPHFLSFAGHLVAFILVGKVFRKAFRILELDERKGRWVVDQEFPGNFHVNVTWLFYLFLHSS